MSIVELLIIIFFIYFAIYFVDSIFRTCYFYPYLRFLDGTGLTIGFGSLTWQTTAFNRSLRGNRQKIFTQWFDIGILCTMILLPITVYLLLKQLIQNFLLRGSTSVKDTPLSLDAMIPGLTLPYSDMWFYVLTVAVASIVHELGHFLAARREDVSICSVGFMLLFVLPVAFVRLNTYQMFSLNAKKQLRIVCAGVWHNIVLALIFYCFMMLLPNLLEPFYDAGKGVKVKYIHENSAAAGPKGILLGDHLSAINDCEVSDTERWLYCLKISVRKPSPGYCVTKDMVHQMDESIPLKHGENGQLECCDTSKISTHMCFETILVETEADPLEMLQYSCLPARMVIAGTAFACRRAKDCPPPMLHCIQPVLSNHTKLLRIQRFETNSDVVIFVGDPREVLRDVHVTDYAPKYSFLPVHLPDVVFKFSLFVIALSSGMALINTIPCFYTDGHFILQALLRLFAVKSSQQPLLLLVFNAVGTFFLVSNFAVILYTYFT